MMIEPSPSTPLNLAEPAASAVGVRTGKSSSSIDTQEVQRLAKLYNDACAEYDVRPNQQVLCILHPHDATSSSAEHSSPTSAEQAPLVPSPPSTGSSTVSSPTRHHHTGGSAARRSGGAAEKNSISPREERFAAGANRQSHPALRLIPYPSANDTTTTATTGKQQQQLVLNAFDFRFNMIGARGLPPLLRVCVASPHLRVLILSNNYLTNDLVCSLATALEQHPSLEFLDVSQNAISQPAGKALFHMASRAPMLTTIRLEGTLINPALVERVQQVLQQRVASAAASSKTANNNITTEQEKQKEALEDSTERLKVAAQATQEREVSSQASESEIQEQPIPAISTANTNSDVFAVPPIVVGNHGDTPLKSSAGEALVAPPPSYEALSIAFTVLRDSDSSELRFVTKSNHAVALLMQSTRAVSAATPHHHHHHHRGSVDYESACTTPHSCASPKGHVTTANFPQQSFGRRFFPIPSSAGTTATGASTPDVSATVAPVSPTRTSQQESPADSNVAAGASPTITTTLDVLPILLELPDADETCAVGLLLRSAVHSGLITREVPLCNTLAHLRSTTDLELRDGGRSALNILLHSAFGDPLPQFNEILYVPKKEQSDDVSDTSEAITVTSVPPAEVMPPGALDGSPLGIQNLKDSGAVSSGATTTRELVALSSSGLDPNSTALTPAGGVNSTHSGVGAMHSPETFNVSVNSTGLPVMFVKESEVAKFSRPVPWEALQRVFEAVDRVSHGGDSSSGSQAPTPPTAADIVSPVQPSMPAAASGRRRPSVELQMPADGRRVRSTSQSQSQSDPVVGLSMGAHRASPRVATAVASTTWFQVPMPDAMDGLRQLQEACRQCAATASGVLPAVNSARGGRTPSSEEWVGGRGRAVPNVTIV